VRRDVGDALALDEHLTAVVQRFEIIRASTHGCPRFEPLFSLAIGGSCNKKAQTLAHYVARDVRDASEVR
jgi:hypothetical protein